MEYLIRLLETDDYVNNTLETSWLDDLIAERFQSEKTLISNYRSFVVQYISQMKHFEVVFKIFNLHLSGKIREEFYLIDCLSVFSSGQILPMSTLSISRHIELIYEYIKYKLQVNRFYLSRNSMMMFFLCRSLNVVQVVFSLL